MARDSQKLEQEFIARARENTGHDVDEWIGIIGKTGLDKPNAILKWLKETHKLNHMQANFLSGIYMNGGKPVFDYDVLFANLFQGKDHLRPVYDALEKQVCSELDDVVFVPTKAYISIEGKRVFACAALTKTSIRVGLDLGDLPFDDYVQKAKSLGAMPNIGHMVEISQPADVNDRLIGHFRQAYDRVHNR